jgi:glycosyltransferase involved in cell wall biosynthesis
VSAPEARGWRGRFIASVEAWGGRENVMGYDVRQQVARLRYDVVIATRNRIDALGLSLPLLLAQTRPPEKVVIVDSSDDPAPIRELVARIAGATPIPVHFIGGERGLTRQRNLGLQHVDADVVMFPDDDSLLPSETMARIMAVYECDVEGVVGGVCGNETADPPVDLGAVAYRKSLLDRIKTLVGRSRVAVERRIAPDIRELAGRRLWRDHTPPRWMPEVEAVPVEHMTGFRMSFRTAAIKPVGFDETLALYGLFEDTEASLHVLRNWQLLAADTGWIYHHRDPGRREGGRRYGVTQILNCAYVVAKHVPMDAAFARAMRRAFRYRLFLYTLGARSAFGRERLAGAWAAYRLYPALLQAPSDALPDLYRTLCARALEADA